MTAVQVPYLGKDMLIKVGDGAANESFTTLGGLRATSVKINQQEIDVTSKDGSRWRKLIAGGIRSIDISGGGVFEDDPELQWLIYKIINTDGGYKGNFRITMGNGATFTGSFILKAIGMDGPHDKDETYTIELASAGDITLVMPAPTFTSVTPATGAHGSTVAAVALVGTGFLPGMTVKINDVACTAVVIIDGTHATFTAPAQVAGGTYDIKLTNPDGGTVTATGAWTST